MTLDDFLKYVLPDVVGCPSGVAKTAVLAAAKEFLVASAAWNEVQDPIALQADVYEYDLEAPAGARCIDIRDIHATFMGGGKLWPRTLDQIVSESTSWATETGNLPNRYTRAFDFSTFRVFPIPTAPDGQVVRVHAVYSLKDTATAIPDEIVERYGEVIASGAKARLLRMPGTTWKDLQLSQFHQGLFENGKTVAAITTEHSKTRGEVTVPPRRFGR